MESLIIDQPEDVMENRPIHDAVAKILSEGCRARPVSVTTHHANIPILGNAECSSSSTQPRVDRRCRPGVAL